MRNVITDVLRGAIRLSGLRVWEVIGMVFLGLLPGEKIFQELVVLRKDAEDESGDIRKIVKAMVPTYAYDEKKTA